MKAVVLTGIRQLEINDVPAPAIQHPEEVLLRISAVGVCGSDLHYYETGRIGSQVVQFPFILGHECTAEVVACGSGARRVRPGDFVAVDPAMVCHRCDQCLAGRENTCRQLRFLGCPGQSPGCLSEFLVMPEDCLYPVPAGIPEDLAVLAEPMSIGLYAAAQVQVGPETQVGILGCGPIGLSVWLACRQRGVRQGWMTDKINHRLEVARRLGAAGTANPLDEDVVGWLSQHVPGGLDVVFECAGQPEAIDQAVDWLKPGGCLALVGIPRQDRISLAIDLLRRKEITIVNIRRQRGCMAPALGLLSAEPGLVKPLLTHEFRPDQTAAAFDLVADYRDGVIKAVVFFMRQHLLFKKGSK
jgi:L-iditol 2-dehydrogenase